MASHTCLLAALACANAKRVTLAVANERAHRVRCTLDAGASGFVIPARTGQLLQTDLPTSLVCGGVIAEIDGDGYVVARVGDDAITVGDANEFQLELSRAAHKCDGDSFEGAHGNRYLQGSFQDCVWRHAFGGGAEANTVARKFRRDSTKASCHSRLK